MLQLGNLAVVCAKRDDVLMKVYRGAVTVYVGQGPQREKLTIDWCDNASVEQAIRELNHGKYANTRKDAAA